LNDVLVSRPGTICDEWTSYVEKREAEFETAGENERFALDYDRGRLGGVRPIRAKLRMAVFREVVVQWRDAAD
jgi:hypothetical protein